MGIAYTAWAFREERDDGMIEKKRSKGRFVLTLLDAVVSIAVLMLALELIRIYTEDVDPERLHYATKVVAAVALYFTLAAAELIRFFIRRDGTILCRVRHLLGVVLFAASGVLLLTSGGDHRSAYVSCVCYSVTLILACIDSVLRDHRARKIISNIFLILIILFLLWLPTGIFFAPVLMTVLSLVHIGGIAFSQINFRALEKIIRKTYAIEIIFGMLLLMVAFSIMLQSTEASIETFADGLWYCFAIVTTIGFGDYAAEGLLGRMMSVILGIYGIIVVSLITSIIVNFYNEVKDEPEEPPLPPPEEEAEKKKERRRKRREQS